jgi:hypothetical protein
VCASVCLYPAAWGFANAQINHTFGSDPEYGAVANQDEVVISRGTWRSVYKLLLQPHLSSVAFECRVVNMYKRKHGNRMSTGGAAPRNPLACKAPRIRQHRRLKKSLNWTCRVVLQRLTPAQIDAAMYAGVKQVITRRMGTGGVAPRKILWKSK